MQKKTFIIANWKMNMSVEDAIKLVVSAGMVVPPKK